MSAQTTYVCIFRTTEIAVWVSSTENPSVDDAINYGAEFNSEIVGIVAINPGIFPPVGMRSEDCSHIWVRRVVFDADHKASLAPYRLTPNPWLERRRDAEFSRKVRSTQA